LKVVLLLRLIYFTEID